MASFAALSDGLILHYHTCAAGSAEPLILIHALGTDLRLWDEVVALLTPHTVIIRYDLRGHGLSSVPPAPYSIRDHADDLKALFDYLELRQAVVCGISVGGLIAMQFALDHPDCVTKLILCDTDAKISSPEFWDNRIAAVRERGLDAISADILARWFAPEMKQKQPANWEGFRLMLSRQNVEGYIGVCASLRDADLRGDVHRLRLPVFVVCGENDMATNPESAGRLAASIPDSRLMLIPECGHLPPVEQPETFAHHLLGFLRGDDRSGGYAHGMMLRRSILGDTHVDHAEANKTDFDSEFQRFITEVAWGNVWARGVIDRPTRHLLTIAMLAALGKEHELAMHLRATRNTGVTLEQLREVFFQVAVYAGVPAANRAFALAKQELINRE
jgi:3-oxoadipate enol-lactonase/4-carboxymuconolactone decarboxylase